MRVKIYNNNIVHLIFPNQKELTMTMCRLQEFYESDNVKLRSRIFTFEQFIDQYTHKDGCFDYFSFWGGFNIPGHVVEDFFDVFELTNRELEVRKATKKYSRKPYYLIGTLIKDVETTKHELLHAYYYLDTVYKQQVDVLVRSMDKDLKKSITVALKNIGYANHVIIDEINAYMASSTHKYLKNDLDLDLTKADMKPFVDLSKTVLRGSYSGNTLAFQAKARSSILLPRSNIKGE